ncbi:uncharacterized protein GJ701_006447 [Geothlypis trichas]
MKRKDSFQNNFDTSMKRRSILTKAWSQSSALMDSMPGDRGRQNVTNHNTQAGTRNPRLHEYSSIFWTEDVQRKILNPECAEDVQGMLLCHSLLSPCNTKSRCEVETVRKDLEQKHDFQNFLSLTLIAH